jgi:hypothetical protein
MLLKRYIVYYRLKSGFVSCYMSTVEHILQSIERRNQLEAGSK